ncbi:MAG TPA: hypothetical protein P5065_08500 [Candidatus Ratteibacteria bacterium]|nr:hypothetical protein [Candidatus Ratteibacteria bacterium]HRV05091.1 hypothetical protein [Candidatus Ratteibacteria bacterium]
MKEKLKQFITRHLSDIMNNFWTHIGHSWHLFGDSDDYLAFDKSSQKGRNRIIIEQKPHKMCNKCAKRIIIKMDEVMTTKSFIEFDFPAKKVIDESTCEKNIWNDYISNLFHRGHINGSFIM